MRDLFVALVVFGFLPMALRRPQVGIYLWSWIGYNNPHRLSFGWALNFPWAMIIALTTFASILFSKEPKRIPWTRETVILLVFIFWMVVTSTFAFYPQLAWDNFIKVFKILLMTYVTLMVINSRERLNGMIWVICISLGFYGIKGGVFTILKGGVHRVQGPDGTFFGGNNEMALVLAMTIPLLAYLRMQETRAWLKNGLGAAMMLSAIAAIGSQSRGGLIGMATMGLFLWLKSRSKFMTALMIGTSVLVIASIMPQSWYDRMNTTRTYEQDRSAQGRISAWWTAFNLAKDRVTGGGFETFQVATFDRYSPTPDLVHDVHSIYFEVMGEHGFIGLGIFMSLGLMTWVRCNQIVRQCKHYPERKWASDLASMIQVSMVGYASAGAFLGLAYFDLYYHLVAMSVLTWTFINGQSPPTVAAPDIKNRAVRNQRSRTAAPHPN